MPKQRKFLGHFSAFFDAFLSVLDIIKLQAVSTGGKVVHSYVSALCVAESRISCDWGVVIRALEGRRLDGKIPWKFYLQGAGTAIIPGKFFCFF